jgi:hypothetical protein
MVEKGVEAQFDRSSEKWSSITQIQGGEEYPAYNKRKRANLIGHILCRHGLLQDVIDGKMEERV